MVGKLIVVAFVALAFPCALHAGHGRPAGDSRLELARAQAAMFAALDRVRAEIKADKGPIR